MPRSALILLAVPALLAACDSTETNEVDNLAQNVSEMDTSIDSSAPVDNSVPAATIPEETMPPVLPDPVDTQALGNNGVVPNADNGTGNSR